ncbi:threonine aldolase family protein [Archangium violaceum]|uniref:threonine aldolase family protein n=1 Tax=Archangium violaceum TaxID=83451 RepID=UPI001EF0F834|nr:low specificity L-threonine aldolase [Archangium violaceum]
MNPKRGFASDNNAGIHPTLLEAIARANVGHSQAYGNDAWTERAVAKFREHLGSHVDVHFVFNGTGANVLGLSSLLRPYHAILCAETAHINVDECGAPEKLTGGSKLVDIPTPDGKLTPALVEPRIRGLGDQHHVQPRVISISQSTELGTVYTPEEIRALADLAHRHGMYLHMDGARISNAAAALGVPLRAITTDCGVDILSFGGTKIGMMVGEAVVVFDPKLAPDFKFLRKQGMQLASKMRFVAAQFEALLTDELWLKIARHANAMAALLAREVSSIPKVRLTRPTQANGVFAALPAELIPRLQEHAFFYVWDEPTSEVRWMTSFDTTEEDVRGFAHRLRELVGG